MIRFRRWRACGGLGSDQPGTEVAYCVEQDRPVGTVNARSHKLFRQRGYGGHLTVYRDEESGGVVLEFDALRHKGKEPRIREIVAPESVDTLIVSLLEVRGGDWQKKETRDA